MTAMSRLTKAFLPSRISESLQTCLRRLPDPQLRLIEGLFWEEKTEVEVAGILCLTQSGISRRKQRHSRTTPPLAGSDQIKKKLTAQKIEVIKGPPSRILMT